jgi:hypothetical protein
VGASQNLRDFNRGFLQYIAEGGPGGLGGWGVGVGALGGGGAREEAGQRPAGGRPPSGQARHPARGSRQTVTAGLLPRGPLAAKPP